MAGEIPSWHEEPEELQVLLQKVDGLCRQDAAFPVQACLDSIGEQLMPDELPLPLQLRFVALAVERGLVPTVVQSLGASDERCAISALNLLVQLAFGSAKGAGAVLESLDDVAQCVEPFLANVDTGRRQLLRASVTLIGNLASLCPHSHRKLLPIVQPVILQALSADLLGDGLLSDVVLLLANLSSTLAGELRQLGVAEALLGLVMRDVPERSVAESVVVYLQDGRRCEEVDALMKNNLVACYCVPLLEATVFRKAFRGMYPYLSYTAQLFWQLSRSRTYAQALVADARVVPLLLLACEPQPELGSMDFGAVEGRRLALETVRHLAAFGLCPEMYSTQPGMLSKSLCDADKGIRASAAHLLGQLNMDSVAKLLIIAQRMDRSLRLPPTFWREQVLSYIFPFLSQ